MHATAGLGLGLALARCERRSGDEMARIFSLLAGGGVAAALRPCGAAHLLFVFMSRTVFGVSASLSRR